MYPLYKKEAQDLEYYRRSIKNIAPSLHAAIELVHVTEGAVMFGVEENSFRLEEGDLGIVFSNQVHFYRIPENGSCTVEFLLAAPSLTGSFLHLVENYMPEKPLVRAGQVHPDVHYAMKTLAQGRASGEYSQVLQESYVQIILSRILPLLSLQERTIGEGDLVERVVSYIAGHYMEQVTLNSMAKDLYVNPFALSRIFSQAFHMNFNRYLNLTRLEYCRHMLESTDLPVTEICLDAGFGSQRTFNRVFRDEYHVTPAEFRRLGQVAPGYPGST